MKKLLLLLSVLTTLALPAQVQLTDLNTDVPTGGGAILEFTRLGNRTVFLAESELEGIELYGTNHTTGTTTLLKNINPGGQSSNNNSYPWSFNSAVYDGDLYFNASGSIEFLWKTDGTLSGTDQLLDVPPGYLSNLTTVDDRLYFTVNNPATNRPAVYYLTPNEVVLVTDQGFEPGTNFFAIGAAGDRFLFQESGGMTNRIWSTDGTAAGTQVLYGNAIFALNGAFNRFQPQVTLGDRLLFHMIDNDAAGGMIQTVISDGTPAGTESLATHYNAFADGFLTGGNGTTCNGRAYWTLYNIYQRRMWVWTSDGTPAGTTMLADESTDVNFFFASDLLCVDDALYYTGPGAQEQTVLRRAELPAFTNTELGDVFPAVGGANYFYERDRIRLVADDAGHVFGITAIDNEERVFSVVNDDFQVIFSDKFFENYIAPREMGATLGFEGNPATISPVSLDDPAPTEINTTAGGAVRFNSTATVRNRFLFFGNEGSPTNNLYTVKSSGDVEKLVPNGVRAQLNNPPQEVGTVLGNLLIFSADDPVAGTEPWVTDGTPAGTERLADIRPGLADALDAQTVMVSWNGHVYFTALDAADQYQLYRTDGTPAGTEPVLALTGTDGAAQRVRLGAGNDNQLLLYANTPGGGQSLWSYDGTNATRLKDNAYVQEMLAVGNRFFLSLNDIAANQGTELFVSNGTPGGTVRVKDIQAGPNASTPLAFRNVNGTVYFTATTTGTGRELFTTDGTAAGTGLLQDAFAGPGDFTNGFNLEVFGDALYLVGFTPSTGFELFRADASGVSIVTDINAGATNANVSDLYAAGDLLYFSAATSDAGSELWSSDGTAANTQRITDINPGAGSSNPSQVTTVGDKLFFIANDGSTGYEVWRLGEPVGLPAVPELNTLNAQPNPTAALTQLRLPRALTTDGHLRVLDMRGRPLRERTIPAGDQLITVDLSAYPAGAYLILLQSGDQVWTEQLLRQ